MNIKTNILNNTSGTGITSLDGLRGVAVLFVFLSHTSGRDQYLSSSLNFHGIGIIGVYLFFVLSGFLLTYSLLNKNEFSVKSYYLRRFLRISPLYYSVVICVFLYQLISGSISTKYLHIKDGLSGFIQHIFFYQGDGLFWTIPTEIQFYIVLPLIVMILCKYKLKAFYFLSLLISINFIIYFLVNIKLISNNYLISFNLTDRGNFIDVFFCGIVAAFLINNSTIKSLYAKNKNRFDIFFLLLFLFILLCSCVFVAKQFVFFKQIGYDVRFLSLIYGICWSLILISIMFGNRFLKSIFELKVLRTIGITGFSWYLLHMAVISTVNQVFDMIDLNINILKFIFSFASLYILCVVTYTLIEKPFVNIGKALTQKKLLSINHKVVINNHMNREDIQV